MFCSWCKCVDGSAASISKWFQLRVSETVLSFLIYRTPDFDSLEEVGNELCTNPIVRKISFTGSTRVGKLLMRLSSDTVKRLTLELGGNAPFVVFEDANIDQAVGALMASKFRNAGQTCVCADRILVHSAIHDEFVDKLAARVKEIRVGPGMDASTTMGPLITPEAVQDVHGKVQEALSEGASCVVGGSPLPSLGPHFYDPTILTNVSPDSRIWKTETFGPVAAIYRFDTEEEALELANNSTVGLASYFCTRDLERAFRCARK
jgi:succinate-semialdehyde dehydrogenase/glutarate-semialdehyde dehydrogenase